MAIYKISSELRTSFKKSDSKNLRKEGRIPGIYYFKDEVAQTISVNLHDLHDGIRSGAYVFDLTLGKKSHKVVIKDVQYDPVTDNPIHIDFLGVDLREAIEVSIPIKLQGSPEGVKSQGGVMSQNLWELHIKCRVADIPNDISIDVSDLNLGESLSVNSLELENVEILDSPSRSIVSVVVPTGAASLESQLPEEGEELEEGEEAEGVESVEGEEGVEGEETKKPEESPASSKEKTK